MADLQALQAFAAAHGFQLTHPLTHHQVVTLAEYWLPEVRFHPDERFHPISLAERIDMVEGQFQEFPPAEQPQWRVRKLVRTEDDTGRIRLFDPPVLTVSDGAVTWPDPETGIERTDGAVRVLNDGTPTHEAFGDPLVDGETVFSQGVSAPRAREFFGARRTAAGQVVGSPGDPLLPRAMDSEGHRSITIMATYKNLIDLLRYELLVQDAPDYPPDGLRGGFDIAQHLLNAGRTPLTAGVKRQVLLDLVAAYEAGDVSAETPGLPPDWSLNRKVWDVITRYAFLEYDFFYAFNDWERYQVALWDNQHEGDSEGCCLVFDRGLINVGAAADDDDQLRRAVPHYLITCVHEELHDSDLIATIPTPVPPPDDPQRLPRQDLPLIVYAAGGSHATYLTPGTHDVVDFSDMWATAEDLGGTILLPVHLLPVLVVLAMIECFQDTHDFTSDDGIRTGPAAAVDGHPAGIATDLVVLPMSVDNHIYQPQNADLLRLRAFPGKWGANDGPRNRSGPLEAKSGRYFRKLLQHL
ncbi:hypothetical protein [Streptomyces canus]|uniref:hypothetical protein n=1 Tax=Streptomyces canus TaxID=58343 RepID=UPI002E3273B5|nr:hypothetical protein [Streptomyces canus]